MPTHPSFSPRYPNQPPRPDASPPEVTLAFTQNPEGQDSTTPHARYSDPNHAGFLGVGREEVQPLSSQDETVSPSSSRTSSTTHAIGTAGFKGSVSGESLTNSANEGSQASGTPAPSTEPTSEQVSSEPAEPPQPGSGGTGKKPPRDGGAPPLPPAEPPNRPVPGDEPNDGESSPPEGHHETIEASRKEPSQPAESTGPEPGRGDGPVPPTPPPQELTSPNDYPGDEEKRQPDATSFGVERFVEPRPPAAVARRILELHTSGVVDAIRKNQGYADGYTTSRIGRVTLANLENETPEGIVMLRPQILDYGSIGWGATLDVGFGGETVYQYYPGTGNVVRRWSINLNMYEDLPKDGEVPDRLHLELGYKRSAEMASLQRELNNLGFLTPEVGIKQAEYIYELLRGAEPEIITYGRLSGMIERVLDSPLTPERQDSVQAAGLFTRTMHTYLQDEEIVETSVEDPDTGEQLHIRAGERRDEISASKTPFIEIGYTDDSTDPTDPYMRERFLDEELAERTAGLDLIRRQANYSFRIVNDEFMGATSATYRSRDGDLIKAWRPQLFRADFLIAQSLRNFLRKPMVTRR